MGVTKSRTQLNEHARILILPIFKCGEHFVFDYRSQCVESQKTRALVLILSRLLQLPGFWWVLYQFLCFWGRDSSMWIFSCVVVEGPTPLLFRGQWLFVFFPKHFPRFPPAGLCWCALLFQTNETIHTESKPWPSSFQFLPGLGIISSGTHLLWAPKTILLNTCPLIHKWSYLDLLDSHRTNFKLLPEVCRPTRINRKSVHLFTFFIPSQASVICLLLALVCTYCFFKNVTLNLLNTSFLFFLILIK